MVSLFFGPVGLAKNRSHRLVWELAIVLVLSDPLGIGHDTHM